MKINENFVLKQIDNEYIFIPLGQEAIDIKGLLKVNEVGYDIYNFLDSGLSVEDTIKEMVKLYNADEKVIASDTQEFVDKLIKFGVYK